MIKKLNIFIVFIIMINITVSANPIYISYSDDDTNKVVIGGEDINLSNSKITVSVFKAGKSYNDLEGEFNDETELFPYVGTTVTDDSGKWSVVWKLDKSGDYDLYVSADGKLLTQEPVNKYLLTNYKEIYNRIINDNEENLKVLFSDKNIIKAFADSYDEKYDSVSSDLVAKSLVKLRQNINDKVDIKDCINLAINLGLLEKDKDTDSLDIVLNLMSSMGFSVKNVEVYNQKASDSVKENIALRLDKCTDMDVNTFSEKFNEALILSGVYKSGNWSDAQEYLDLLNNETYIANKTAVAKYVVGKDYTIDTLNTAIKEAVKNQSGNVVSSQNGSSGGSSGGGSGGSHTYYPNNTQVTATETEETDYYELQKIFSDVTSDYWAYDYINYLRWKNIVCGDENGCFYPEGNITRAEMVKMLCEAYKIDVKPTNNVFSDVNSDDWFCNYVNSAYDLGYVKGISDTEFAPNNNITRQDMALIMSRFADLKVLNQESYIDNYPDGKNVSDYAKDAFNTMINYKIILGNDGLLQPHENATRAMAATMLYKLLEYNQ